MDIQINTAAVLETADLLHARNNKIRDELSEIDEAIQLLRQDWEGKAADSGITKYHHIKRNFADARYSVIQGIESVMRIQAGEGYETTEQTLSSAASEFK